MVKLTINATEQDIEKGEQIVEALRATAHQTHREVWLAGAHVGPSLCALINGDVGWLMFLREPGDAGFSSRNPSYIGPTEATRQYLLSNGQVDQYPAQWAIALGVIENALVYFFDHSERAPFVSWHDDSV